jgi:hypothetical protein
MDVEKTIRNLKLRRFEVSHFATGSEAADYLCSQIQDTEVGIGGCKTADQIGLYEKLCEKNTVHWHWKQQGWDVLEKANASPVYIAGANAISEDGQIVEIDGRGNRLAGLVFGKKRVYIVASTSKICPDFEAAVYRAHNTAAIENIKRFPVKPPCQIDGKCHDCRSPQRVCNAMLVLWGPMMDMEKIEVVLIDEPLGL